ncbi:MAG: GNAT family N-acetyltransferase [Bryobacteraceae bacterium]|nr:GNAT family N-acetyltransferase [Bryobacteraceae bacterium]
MSLRRFTIEDIPAGLALCRAAGWNQVERDWREILERGDAWVAEADGSAAGSVAVLRYPTHDWIAMLLVAPEYRGQGLGTRLLLHALSECRGVVGLDATPEGRRVYLKHGFEDDFELVRMEGEAPGGGGGPRPPWREGYFATHVGPLDSLDQLRAHPAGERIVLDVPVMHAATLPPLGFVERRRLIRMWRGAPPALPVPFAIRGPEFG